MITTRGIEIIAEVFFSDVIDTDTFEKIKEMVDIYNYISVERKFYGVDIGFSFVRIGNDSEKRLVGILDKIETLISNINETIKEVEKVYSRVEYLTSTVTEEKYKFENLKKVWL